MFTLKLKKKCKNQTGLAKEHINKKYKNKNSVLAKEHVSL